MIKVTTTLLFFTLLFTACVERGATLTPKIVQTKPVAKKTCICTKKSISDTKKVQQKVKTTSSNTKLTVVVEQTKPEISNTKLTVVVKQTKPEISNPKIEVKEQSFVTKNNSFSFSDDTKNKISGLFIFVIGLMIFI